MGLSVEQVADQLKLAPRQVLAIEQGNFDALPNRAVTRGFIRAYAKAMRLDPAPLVAMVEVEGAEGHATATVRPTKVQASFQESRFPSLTERNNGKPMGAIVAGVAVVALVGVAAAWQMGVLAPLTLATRAGVDAPAEAPATAEPSASLTVAPPAAGAQPAEAPLQTQNVPLISVPPQAGSNPAPATVPGAGIAADAAAGTAPANRPGLTTAAGTQPAATTQAPGTAPANRPAPTTATGTQPAATTPAAGAAPANRPAPTIATGAAAAPGAAQAPATAPGLIPAKPAAGAPAAAATPAATGSDTPAGAPSVGAAGGKLTLTVKEDSWIEIRRPGQSASLIARLVKAGSTETFNVREKDLLIVGKPGGVSANLAGAQLDLPQVPGGTISRVNIK